MAIEFGNMYLGSVQARGDIFTLKTTHASHFGGGSDLTPAGEKSFGQMMFDALATVNDDQQYAHDLSIRAAADPTSVEAHDVTIAMAKANLSLSLTKNVVDKVISAYREITTLR